MSGDGSISFTNSIVDKAAVTDMIVQGDYMIIAGDERVLSELPSGNWIAGTIPYFMTEDGGQIDQDRVYVTRLQGLAANNPPRLTLYDASSISRIAQEAPQHGFTVLILPASSEVHLSYAQNAPDFPNMYFSPIIGWISGVHLSELADRKAKTGFGPAAGMLSDSKAAAMHPSLLLPKAAKWDAMQGNWCRFHAQKKRGSHYKIRFREFLPYHLRRQRQVCFPLHEQQFS